MFQPISVDPDVMLEVSSRDAAGFIASHAVDLCRPAHLPKRRNSAVLQDLTTQLYYKVKPVFWIRSDADRGQVLLMCKLAIQLALANHPDPYQDGQRVR